MGRGGRADQGLKNHIKQHRARLSLTQEQLARAVGVRRQTIISIERRRYVPSALLAFRIARALGMRADEVFELTADEGGEQGVERGGEQGDDGSDEGEGDGLDESGSIRGRRS
jgi:putative transcriptional regulator